MHHFYGEREKKEEKGGQKKKKLPDISFHSLLGTQFCVFFKLVDLKGKNVKHLHLVDTLSTVTKTAGQVLILKV